MISRFDKRRRAAFLVATAMMLGSAGAAVAAPDDEGEMHHAAKPVEAMTLPEKPAGAHWVWMIDLPQGEYNRALLYDADKGMRLATVDIGFEGPKILLPNNPDAKEFYSGSIYYSRAMRGKREDMIEVFDKKTMTAVREIPIPAKQIRGWADPTLSNVSDDDSFVLTQFFTPASSVGITNVKVGKFGSEVQTSGCAHVFPAGDHRFFTLCGDGSALAITYNEDGKEVSRKRYAGLFDADKDPLHGSGFRSGNVWYFASHRGQIHAVDVSGADLKFLPTWNVAVPEGNLTWTPGSFRESVAIHRKTGRLFLAMHLSNFTPKGAGPDFQAEDGTEIWSFDMKTHKLLIRFKTEESVAYFAVSQDDKPYVYTSDMWHHRVGVYDAATGKLVNHFGTNITFNQTLQPVE